MRLLNLEICNIRGIKHLQLDINGNNFIVYGLNGSGKSGIVDAMEFLLTGKISRLSGSGTSGITLGKHGHHVDCDPDDAYVKGVFKLPDIEKPIELKRTMNEYDNLQCSTQMVPQLERILSIAKRGHIVLTRREILMYIISKAATRAEKIQELLNIIEIENIRKAFVKTKNDIEKKYKAAKSPVNEAKEAIKSTMQSKTFREDALLKAINENRSILGGKPVSKISSLELKTGLSLSTVAPSNYINIKIINDNIETIRRIQKDDSDSIINSELQLCLLINKIQSDPKLSCSLSIIELIELGIGLIDERGNCPLCETEWKQGKLIEYLNNRLSDAKGAKEIQIKIGEHSDNISKHIKILLSNIESIRKITDGNGDLNDEAKILDSWLNELRQYLDGIDSLLEKYPNDRFVPSRINTLFAPDDLESILIRIQSLLKEAYPEATPEQKALIMLTRFEENLKALERAKEKLDSIEIPFKRACSLLDVYQKARDDILGRLYDDIEDRFVELYKEIHGNDEANFKAIIEPDGAGLNFEVDFYGRGTHPPHALHSEGHQDSMGLCLYLALVEKINEGLIDLVILDDVMMSVDATHRKEVCHLILNHFSKNQFLITTHDKTWAYQMKSEGIINSKGLIEFYNWHVETGPLVNYEVDLWKQIDADIAKGDIPAASARLRRGAEQFFSFACEALMAPISCKINGQWDLGELANSTIAQYKNLLRKAKISANSWNKKDHVKELKELEEYSGKIISDTQAEQWAVNANVHYNNWAVFSPKDFAPVVSNFKALFHLFICNKCGGIIHLSLENRSPAQVRCSCLNVNWNLIEKKK